MAIDVCRECEAAISSTHPFMVKTGHSQQNQQDASQRQIHFNWIFMRWTFLLYKITKNRMKNKKKRTWQIKSEEAFFSLKIFVE